MYDLTLFWGWSKSGLGVYIMANFVVIYIHILETYLAKTYINIKNGLGWFTRRCNHSRNNNYSRRVNHTIIIVVIIITGMGHAQMKFLTQKQHPGQIFSRIWRQRRNFGASIFLQDCVTMIVGHKKKDENNCIGSLTCSMCDKNQLRITLKSVQTFSVEVNTFILVHLLVLVYDTPQQAVTLLRDKLSCYCYK